MIPRISEQLLRERLGSGKVLVLMGPRQTGKTTLVQKLMAEQLGKTLYLTGDDPAVRSRLNDAPLDRLRQMTEGLGLLVIDEAQRLRNIGLTLKMLADHCPKTQVIATGSSSFDLANEINEPLTGRKFDLHLFPVSWQEWAAHIGAFQANTQLEQRLLFGMYPEVLNNPGHEKEKLVGLASDNLYKDLLSFAPIRKPEILEKLLQALALQMGNEVSLNELSNLLKVDKQTVGNYIAALEKAYVIFRLRPFSRNLRQEIASTQKVYFYDNGIRNALIGNFSPLALRSDVGALWENFLISERLKRNHYALRFFVNTFFWRTKQGQEIDFLEDSDGQLSPFEFKWNPERRVSFPKIFMENYEAQPGTVVHPDNFEAFVS